MRRSVWDHERPATLQAGGAAVAESRQNVQQAALQAQIARLEQRVANAEAQAQAAQTKAANDNYAATVPAYVPRPPVAYPVYSTAPYAECDTFPIVAPCPVPILAIEGEGSGL